MLAKEELLPTVNEVVKSLDEYNDYYKGVIDYTSVWIKWIKKSKQVT